MEENPVVRAVRSRRLFGRLGGRGPRHLLPAHAITDTGPSLISSQGPPSADPPPAPSEFLDRLNAKGAKSGDIQISLIWFNVNDLDLHCVDPNGFEIYYKPGQRRSPSGGELDVDANGIGADGRPSPLTAEPVENIYWPLGKAPAGTYRVYVDFYRYRPEEGAPQESSYKVNVLHTGKRKEFSGTIKYEEGGNNKRLIYEFSLAPRIEVYPAGELNLERGSTIRLPVAVRRVFYKGKLDLSAENLPDGATAAKVVIPEGKDDGVLELKASTSAAEGKKPIKIVASGPDVSGSFDTDLTVKLPTFSLTGTIIMGIWTALLAVGLCLALLAGQNRYLSRPLFAAGRISMTTVIVGAVFAGFSSGSVGQALYSVMLAIGAGGVGFVIGWILLGGLLGWGVSFFVSNLDKKKASLAGLAGGLLGAVSYLIGSQIGDIIGRFAGAAALGFCIGLAVAIVEAAFRSAWLEVRFGERETITVNLGAQPVNVGGDSRACTVWARGAADIALRFFVRDAKVICEDVPGRTESVVGDGQSRTAGTVTLTVRTGTSAAPTAEPPSASGCEAASGIRHPKPQAAPVPPPQPSTPPNHDHDDGLPIPMSPTTSARPKVVSILDDEGYSPSPAKPLAAPPAQVRQAACGFCQSPPKPPVPTVPPKPVAAMPPKSPGPPGDAEACPTCKRKSPGKPGARYCMFCDKSY